MYIYINIYSYYIGHFLFFIFQTMLYFFIFDICIWCFFIVIVWFFRFFMSSFFLINAIIIPFCYFCICFRFPVSVSTNKPAFTYSKSNFLYIYISGHKWSTTHRVLKSHRNKMSVIYMQSWKYIAGTNEPKSAQQVKQEA